MNNTDNTSQMLSDFPEAFMALLKIQAIYKQREADKDVPKGKVEIRNLTREQAQRISDELCQMVLWNNEYVSPKVNAGGAA
jgi:hypothetical protein